jgi:hypothetical protein
MILLVPPSNGQILQRRFPNFFKNNSKNIDGRSKIDELPYPSSTAKNAGTTFTTAVTNWDSKGNSNIPRDTR